MADNERKGTIRIALIAAGAVLAAGTIFGVSKLMKIKSANNSQVTETTTVTEAATTTAIVTTTTTTTFVTTAVTTTAVNAVEPVKVPVTTEAHDDVPEELTGDWLRERCLNATHYYNKFSADYNSDITSYGLSSKSKGIIKIDNTAMTGEMTEEYDSDGDISPSGFRYRYYFLNNIYVDYNCSSEYADEHYISIDSTDKIFQYFKNKPDRVLFKNCGAFSYIVSSSHTNETEWTITDERYENGRRTATVSFSYEIVKEGVHIPYNIKADIDVETGLWTAYELKGGIETEADRSGTTSSFKMTNIRFDDEAEAPKTAAEVRKYIESNGYKEEKNSEFKVENIG